MVDTEKMRACAEWLMDDEDQGTKFGPHTNAALLLSAVAEIDRLRRERAEPLSAEMRLAMYRQGALVALAGSFGASVDGAKTGADRCAESAERHAHAMLAAERPASSSPEQRPEPSEEQIAAWAREASSEACRVWKDDDSNDLQTWQAAVRRVLALAGVLREERPSVLGSWEDDGPGRHIRNYRPGVAAATAALVWLEEEPGSIGRYAWRAWNESADLLSAGSARQVGDSMAAAEAALERAGIR